MSAIKFLKFLVSLHHLHMKNNYHQNFVVVCLMTYIHVRFSTKKFGELSQTSKHLIKLRLNILLKYNLFKKRSKFLDTDIIFTNQGIKTQVYNKAKKLPVHCIVGKGGHTSPFLRFPLLEIQDVPNFHRSIEKTKVLNCSCNQFV